MTEGVNWGPGGGFRFKNIQGVLILCAQKLTTYKIIIGEHCGVILFVKIMIFIKIRLDLNFFPKNRLWL